MFRYYNSMSPPLCTIKFLERTELRKISIHYESKPKKGYNFTNNNEINNSTIQKS
jgi:hypothetical protein